ncbi:MAG TPA: hypothetical protein PLD62_11630, partial [Candidatus Cloacimonadota bacterium]|nr:hypothetical protein [Candidatus Cloacimonadota bacterium]
TISSDDEYVTVTDNTANYGTIAAGTVGTFTDGFEIQVDNLVPDQHDVIMELSATDGTDVWTSYFSFTLNAPVLTVGEMVIDDSAGNANGVLDPGETATVTIPVSNEGQSASPEAIAVLSCNTTGITISAPSVNLGSIDIAASADAVYNVTADASISFGTPTTLYFEVTAGEFLVSQEFPTQVGVNQEDFENGFDDYPWTMQGYTISWPNVNPIEDFTIVSTLDNIDWSLDTTEFYHGTASAKSYPITHNQASFMSITLDVTVAGEISFWYKVACEYSPSQSYFYDGLFFIIDDETIDRFQPNESGLSPWTYFSCPVEAGTHTFDWVYVKDGGDGSSFIQDDCAWVDLITFPCVTPAATGTVSGTVSLIPTADPQNATVQIGSAICHPDVSGAFSLEVPVGNYTATASLEGYETISMDDVSVLENQNTSIGFELYYLQAPENLDAVQNDAIVDLTW